MHFTIFDRTTQMLVQSGSNWTGGGTLEPYHDYLLELHHRAPFGTGDGQMGFAFGFSDSVQVEFASDRTHLVPEVGTAGILGTALAFLAMFHRKIVRR